MDLDGGKIRKEITRWLKGYGRLSLAIGLTFFCATTAWILFEQDFLVGLRGTAGDLIWAAVSAVVLYLLLLYGESMIRKSQEIGRAHV